jgi:hypothetical protein
MKNMYRKFNFFAKKITFLRFLLKRWQNLLCVKKAYKTVLLDKNLSKSVFFYVWKQSKIDVFLSKEKINELN